MKNITILLSILLVMTAFAQNHAEHDEHENHEKDEVHDEHGHHGSEKSIGKGKAIIEVDEQNGFKLSTEAIKTLGIKLDVLNLGKNIIDKKTLVASREIKGVYRYRNGFFNLTPVKIVKEQESHYEIDVRAVVFGDQVVTDGVGLLRVSDIYSTDTSEYGHSH